MLAVVVFVLALIRHKKNPEKSIKNCMISVCLTPIRALKYGPYKEGEISLNKACSYAVKKTKLNDFGSDLQFLHTYDLVLQSDIHKALKFSNLGFISARIEMNMTMVRRLKFIDYLKHNPSVLSVPVPGPVFVMGLPRTGTTYLHRLLSLDPQVRAPLLWELLAPVPGVDGDASKEEAKADLIKRTNYIRKLLETRKSMGDRSLEHIHEVGYDLPEECFNALNDEIPILSQTLYSLYMNIGSPKFQKEIGDKAIENAYIYYRKVLQLLSWQQGERDDNTVRRWMLKCPAHLFYTKEIATAFPDAKLIWTHRHPVSAVPSLCSLLQSLHKIYFERECRNDKVLGEEVNKVTEKLLLQAPRDIVESKLPCAHISYTALTKTPIAVIKGIYQQFGWNFSKEYENILEAYVAEIKSKRDALKIKKGGKDAADLHSYSPEEFHLTAKQLSEGEYAKYIAKFNLDQN